ncbi:putative colanic acid biosynthesis acetyltransferase [Mucilaginibacter sp. HMF5004]|uniref:putative colanic acid biosynthesis acetyltransferase n=1 Tax=Mucilaginibacter rivuli TaxID=2857527 RepID=UPI001C5DA345|nr:putative colanic acid biosynthesis acetyltransferase [Mucilaginibacter rivuli]MBW4890095.1 putative colanic acid biosynthesis acetyltransferase [Mucilaginibacter rivuli]
MKTDLSSYNNAWYNPGASFLKRTIWFYVNAVVFKTSLIPSNGLKAILLRMFGAKIGKGVELKPCINIKYPWFLEVGDFVWIGENVWIDNLTTVTIGTNACISQGAMLLTGNHNYSKPTFNLMVKPIVINEGGWIGAQSVVCPGVTVQSHAVLTAGSIATKNLDAYSIYQGNPAVKIKDRKID